jgi:hypothetical protein
MSSLFYAAGELLDSPVLSNGMGLPLTNTWNASYQQTPIF